VKAETSLATDLNWFKVWVISTVVIYLFELYVNGRQLRMFYSKQVPAEIKSVIKKSDFKKCQDYSKIKLQFSMFKEYVEKTVSILIWTLGFPVAVWHYTHPITMGFKCVEGNPIMYDFIQGMFNFGFLTAVGLAVQIPLRMVETFLVQETHGFNNQTLKGFFKDIFLMLMLQLIFYPLVIYVLLLLVERTGDYFFFYGGLFITVFYIFIIIIAPLVIMPLFNKFDPIENNALKRDIEALAKDCEYPVSHIEIIDGSRRSGHSNAFQYGFGKMKKICIFDTLLNHSLGMTEEAKDEARKEAEEEATGETPTTAVNEEESEEEDKKTEDEALKKKTYKQSDFEYSNEKGRQEILGIVAHELGHWVHSDVPKMIASQLVKVYVSYALFTWCLKYADMAEDFGFASEKKSVYLSFIIFFMVLSPVSYLFNIQDTIMTRSIEFAADRYSIEQGYAYHLKDSLVNIFVKNQGNLNPDWLYAKLKFSHPNLVERVAAIETYASKLAGVTDKAEA